MNEKLKEEKQARQRMRHIESEKNHGTEHYFLSLKVKGRGNERVRETE